MITPNDSRLVPIISHLCQNHGLDPATVDHARKHVSDEFVILTLEDMGFWIIEIGGKLSMGKY